MKKWLIIAGVSAALTACGGDEKKKAETSDVNKTEVSSQKAQKEVLKKPVTVDSSTMQALSEEAKSALQVVGGRLQGALQKAMRSGGPVNAIAVCNTSAPEIAGVVSGEKGLHISRVSLKNRNPEMGKANMWQTKVLEEFEARKAGGEKPMTLFYSEVVEHGGQQEFRYMRAISTGKVCLNCHGTNISPAVQKKLTELYPQDKAIGYKEGDLRGAFVVLKKLN